MDTSEAIARQWIERVLRTYPGQTAAFLAAEPDPFRNPVGNTIRQSLTILLEELLRDPDPGRVTAALDAIVQIRAVQDFTPGRALDFLFQLKPILAESLPETQLGPLYSRIDEMVLLAFDLYVKYRERTYQARAHEAARKFYVLQRRFGVDDGEPERGAR